MLQDVFLKSTTEQIALLMMDVVNVVFKYVPVNYHVCWLHSVFLVKYVLLRRYFMNVGMLYLPKYQFDSNKV